MKSFRPQNAFEGWIKAKIDGIESSLSNHLSHHRGIEKIFISCVATAVLALIVKLVWR